jgi:hypothetical protein
MEDKLFGVFSTIGGLVVGWTLNELSYLFKGNRENEKILNQVLFTQLEIRDILRKTNLTEIEKQISIIFTKKFPEVDPEAFNKTFGMLLFGFIQNELNSKFSSKIIELTENYKANISTLSHIDPITTFSISNKDIILDYLGYIKNYLKSIEGYLNKQVLIDKSEQAEDKSKRTFNRHFDVIRSELTPILSQTAIDTIESDIIIISKKISLAKHIQIRRLLAKTRYVQLENTDIKKVELYINNMKEKYTKN